MPNVIYSLLNGVIHDIIHLVIIFGLIEQKSDL